MKIRKIFLVLGLVIALSIAGFYFYVSSKYVVPILMYHHIDERGEISSLSVSPENFRCQMAFLSRRNYNVISLAQLVQSMQKETKLPRNTVVITFDDGYEDNYTFAYPVLKKYNLPATIFVIVNSIDQENYLTYAQIKEMLSSKGIIDIGSHSLAGGYLPGQTVRELESEIGASKLILEAKLNKSIDFFCYPIGGFSPQIQQLVKKYGYRGACATNRGKRQTYLNDDIFALKRIKVKDSFPNLFVFWVKVSGYYNLFRRVRNPY
ncbi:MAG: polysaccharide deacetylase family protein [Candidatus Omnitrophica bacterium]|nr:polysaccharide deacetylase family protein [Candidatus Omnitrophota bacterium]